MDYDRLGCHIIHGELYNLIGRFEAEIDTWEILPSYGSGNKSTSYITPAILGVSLSSVHILTPIFIMLCFEEFKKSMLTSNF